MQPAVPRPWQVVTNMFDIAWGWAAFIALAVSNRLAISRLSNVAQKKSANTVFASVLLALILIRLVYAIIT